MKKASCFVIVAALLICLVSACDSAKQKQDVFTADNEIFTYQRIERDNTQIVVSITGNIEISLLSEEFEKRNPDVQVICVDITGGNSEYKPLIEWVENGCTPDVVVSAAPFFDDALTVEHFHNLSADLIIQNYEAEALKRSATNDEIYWLPGPSNISAIMYNKTLFQQYGWTVPNTFDEFITLCDKITIDTNGQIQPWNPNAKYGNELTTAIEAFTYEELFGGADNRAWYNGFIDGYAYFSGHMEPYMRVIETLAEHGLLKEEHFTYSATTRSKEFAAGKIAMINGSIFDADNDEYEFGFMPFPTTKGKLGYLNDSYSCFVGLPIKEHTDEQQDATRRFVEFLSSPEGQKAYIDDTMKVSNVKGVDLTQSDDLAELQPAIKEGHMFETLAFVSISNNATMVNLHQIAFDISTGVRTAEQCIEDVDASIRAASDERPTEQTTGQPENRTEVLATAPENMTILETSFYIADAYREAAQADIGLIANNEAYRGNLMRFFSGDITSDMVTVFRPRSFANDSTLVKLYMTGGQLIDALNAPTGREDVANCIYAYSGLICEVAPWNALGEKYLSIKLADGSEIDIDKLYTVAAWSGTVADKYITETIETYEGTWEKLMSEKLSRDGTVTACNDDRIKLIWE